MERNIMKVDESIPVPGASGRTVLARLQAALQTDAAWTITAPADGVLQIAWSKRRLAGRRNVVCTVRAVSDPKGLTVTLNGELDPSHRQAVRDAILGKYVERRADEVVTFASPLVERSTSPFVAPSDWFVSTDSTGLAPSPSPSTAESPDADVTMMRAALERRQADEPVVRVTLDDGRTFDVGGLVLVGRAPTPRQTDEAGATFIRIDDPALSKTHLAVGMDRGFLWLEDRNSSNGVHVIAGERIVALPSGERVTRSLPIELMAGDTRIRIDRHLDGVLG